MFANIRFIIGFFLIITLLILKDIPYINILIKDRIWLAGIVFYILFIILFLPYNFLIKYKKVNYLIIAYTAMIFSLLIFILIPVPFLSEMLGAVVYGLFWILVFYKVYIYLRSSAEND